MVLIPACPGPAGDVARPFGLELTVTVEVHAVGHSAGSYGAMALAAVLEEPAFSQTDGSTKVTAIAMPESLLTRRYRRQVNLFMSKKMNCFFSCICLMASMARSVNCLGQKKAVQVHLIGAKPIVQVKT